MGHFEAPGGTGVKFNADDTNGLRDCRCGQLLLIYPYKATGSRRRAPSVVGDDERTRSRPSDLTVCPRAKEGANQFTHHSPHSQTRHQHANSTRSQGGQQHSHHMSHTFTKSQRQTRLSQVLTFQSRILLGVKSGQVKQRLPRRVPRGAC